MPENKLGESRRSHCIGNFGPGAIVEFRQDGAAISVVVGGQHLWDEHAKPAGLVGEQVTFERRLQTLLKVDGFRLPPVDPDADRPQRAGYKHVPKFLMASRFPLWLQCPKCQTLRFHEEWRSAGVGDPRKYCPDCSDPPNEDFVYVVPARFIVSCLHGHIQDFPWNTWAHGHQDCGGRANLRLYQSGKAGLPGLILECKNCGSARSMEGAFGKDAMTYIGVSCKGEQPWLGKGVRKDCKEIPRAMQRGASNTYFPVVASALAIPPFTEEIQELLDPYWADFAAQPPEEWPLIIKYLRLDEKIGRPKEEILEAARRSLQALDAADVNSLRREEFDKLSAPPPPGSNLEFDLREEAVLPSLDWFFDRLVRVVRLREVRALRSFTRIKPPSGEMEEESPTLAPLNRVPLKWLPAIEVRGEGIFLRFRESSLAEWQSTHPELQVRAATVDKAYAESWAERHETPPPRKITPRFLLVHSFAHALMRQLTLSCGYSSASLRERLYVSDDPERLMAGVLVYTATADSDGSLGGLERQGRAARMNGIVPAAIHASKWCSNDPLCIRDVCTFSDPQNRAACHSCMMVPETSCEEFNVLLDRAMLVGTPDQLGLGYFSRLLDPLSSI